jgi:cytochrome c oxidase subunit 3
MNEIIEESLYQGYHTLKVQKGITIGFSLFVLSEVLIFTSLFFAYFYNSLIPSIELGGL